MKQKRKEDTTAKHLTDGTIDDKAMLEYYWKYFELYSNQRMQMVNFYITVEVVLIGALFKLITLENRICMAEYFVSLAISFISLTFYGLDLRTKNLIHWCEECIETLEKRYGEKFGEELLLMTMSGKRTMAHKTQTYSTWFDLQYIVIGTVGLVMFRMLWVGVI